MNSTGFSSPAQILIVGMHRSGTSAVAGALKAAGLFVGAEEELTGKSWENPRGFFERRDARNLCDALLQGSGADWWKVSGFSADNIDHDLVRSRRPEIRDLVARLDECPEVGWVLKEPRLSLLLPVFRGALESPLVIVVARHPAEVARSLRRRNGFPLRAGLALWEAYMRAAMENACGVEHLIVRYDELLQQPTEKLAELTGWLECNGVTGLDNRAAGLSLDPGLHREQGHTGDNDILSESQKLLWELCSRKKISPPVPALCDSTIQILQEFEAEQALIDRLRKRIRNQDQKIRALKQSDEELNSALAVLRKQTTQQEIQIRLADSQKQALERQLLRSDRALAEYSGYTDALLQLRKDLEKTREKLQNKESAFEALTDAYRSLEKQLHEQTADLWRLKAEHSDALLRSYRRESTANTGISRDPVQARDRIQELERRASNAEFQRDAARLQQESIRREMEQLSTARSLVIARNIGRVVRKPFSLTKYARASRIELSTLFDSGWYLSFCPDAAAFKNPAFHYIMTGGPKGLPPHPVFDPAWWVEQGGGTASLRLTPLEQYLGQAVDERISPHPLFDREWYLAEYPDVVAAGIDPLEHFLTHGGMEGRRPHPEFDAAWYLQHYRDVAEHGTNPLVHYLVFGATEGRDPNPHFSTFGYLQAHPEVAEAGINPLIHWVKSGKATWEGEKPAPKVSVTKAEPGLLSDSSKKNADAYSEDTRKLLIESGFFDARWYCSRYRDVARKGADPLTHFLKSGAREGRDPGPRFATKWYLQSYAEARKSSLNPLEHFLEIGRDKGYLPRPSPRKSLWWDPVRRGVLSIPGTAQQSTCDAKSTLCRIAATDAPKAVIIPVYNAPEEVAACLESVLRHRSGNERLIVIDDASPDRRVADLLKQFEGKPGFEIYHNRTNIGFAGTVNRGIDIAGESDVIVLNSDTIVVAGWVSRLQIAAYSASNIGTVTPLSNNAGAFSAPVVGQPNDLPEAGLDAFARAIAQTSLRLYPKTPTGNGFCLYIRRDCLEETGVFDSDAFPRGYGEENDFCMRALRKGWNHVVDDATYIFHARSASFGAERAELAQAGRAVIDTRYPEYTRAARSFVESKEMCDVREHIKRIGDAISEFGVTVRPRALYVLPQLSPRGGTPQTNQDLMEAIGDRLETFVLRSNANLVELFSFREGEFVLLDYVVLENPIKAFPHRSEEYDRLVAMWLEHYGIELVHIRHIAWHGLGLIEVAKQRGLALVFSFHDFYTVCPNVKLMDENLKYCGGKCTASSGDCKPELWNDKDFPRLKNAGVHEWRSEFKKLLPQCDSFVTTAESAKKVIINNFPVLSEKSFHVIPHGRDFDTFAAAAAPRIEPGSIIRILVPGTIGNVKGAKIIREIALNAERAGIEIHVLGRITEGAPMPGVIVHGEYDRSEFIEKVSKIQPHLGAVFSICPETYSHTLTELWAAGVPAAGFDIGAVGERIANTGAGWVLIRQESAAVLELLEHLRDQPEEYAEKLEKVRDWQSGEGRYRNCTWMAERYQEVYASIAPSLFSDAELNSAPCSRMSGHGQEFSVPVPTLRSNADLEPVTVIVPVHNALEDVKECLRSLVDNTFVPIEIIVINDGSDSKTSQWLAAFAARTPHARLYRNGQALGFTKAVNRGAMMASGHYLVILNSDTVVPPFWLERLIDPLLEDSEVVAAGPVSNAASWQSIPEVRNQDNTWAINLLPEGVDVEEFDCFVQKQAAGLAPEEVTILNGFCYIIRASAFHDCGGLDQEQFPLGYGEETDLFLKLADRGCKTVVVPNIFVYHAKSRSFGARRRNELSSRGNEMLYSRYGQARVIEAASTLEKSGVLATLRSRCRKNQAKIDPGVRAALSILFLLPAKAGSGGVHSVTQEAGGLELLGYDAKVLIPEKYAASFARFYPAQCESGLFATYVSSRDVTRACDNCDVIVATHFFSIRLLQRALSKYPDKLFMYYVQDYEPYIVARDTQHYAEASRSYTALNNAVLMAKTRWICRTVESNHDVKVHKIAPSIDHSIYSPSSTKISVLESRPMIVAAMVRPKTPRRGPEATVAVLRAIKEHFKSDVVIEVFGCSDEELSRLPGVEGFNLSSHGELTREGVASVLKRADLFVDMSTYQAFGRTALEAMACGCAAAVPAEGGGWEYACSSRAALILPTDDTQKSINEILSLLEDRRRLYAMQELGTAVAAQYTIRKASRSIGNLIRRCSHSRCKEKVSG